MKKVLTLCFSILCAGQSFAATTNVPTLKIVDSINIGVSEYIARGLDAAEKQEAPAVLIEMDTPGGFLEATREIVQLMLNSKIPVIVYVTPEGSRAASAGSMITMAAHYAAMAPNTSIGAATPVTMGEKLPEDMRNKVQNDTLSWVEGIAQKRGRNVEWARESVTKAASLSAGEALKRDVIDGVHSSREELWKGFRTLNKELPETVTFVPFEWNVKESFLSLISNPNIAMGLLAIGALGIYTEITHPGTIIPGAIGALSLALGAITMKIIPIRPGAIALMIIGLILFGIEVLTPIPTYGVAGVAGAVAMLLSGIFLMDMDRADIHLSPQIWLPAFAIIIGFMSFLGYQAGKALKSHYAQGVGAFVGMEAEVVTVKDGKAMVLLNGELWQASYKDARGPLTLGQKVKVVEQSGLHVYVVPV
jgi:membrane-bound serine protease (ClpP class)